MGRAARTRAMRIVERTETPEPLTHHPLPPLVVAEIRRIQAVISDMQKSIQPFVTGALLGAGVDTASQEVKVDLEPSSAHAYTYTAGPLPKPVGAAPEAPLSASPDQSASEAGG